MINTFLTTFLGYQDLLNIDQLNEGFVYNNKLHFNLQNKKMIFLLSKNTISMILPNNGKIFGYSLFNNGMNFIFNKTLKEDNSIPLKLNHALVFNNGNTVIDLNFLQKKKNCNNINLEKSLNINNNDFSIIEDNLNVNQSKTLENLNTTNITTTTTINDSSIIENNTNNIERNDLNVDESKILENLNTSSSSSSSNINDSNLLNTTNNNEKIVIFNGIKIKIKNNVIVALNEKLINKPRPIITDENLKYLFENGDGYYYEKNMFLYNFYSYLSNENYYKTYIKSFFLLSENFKEDFKILITLFKRKEFMLDKNIINWFIENKIKNEKLNLFNLIKNLEIPSKMIKLQNTNRADYYDDFSIEFRNREGENDLDLFIFYENVDKCNLLNQLREALESMIRKDQE